MYTEITDRQSSLYEEYIKVRSYNFGCDCSFFGYVILQYCIHIGHKFLRKKLHARISKMTIMCFKLFTTYDLKQHELSLKADLCYLRNLASTGMACSR